MASEQCRAPVVDSARRVKAYPGDLFAKSVVCCFRTKFDLLSTLIPLVHIRVQVDVRDELVQHRSTRLDHAIRELGANADRVSVNKLRPNITDGVSGGTDEIPRIRLIFPGSMKLRVFGCLMTGHRK